MKFADRCLRPYILYGDVAQCWLKNGHPKTCEEANRDRAARNPHVTEAREALADRLVETDEFESEAS